MYSTKVLLVPSDQPEVMASVRLLAARLTAAGLDAVVQPPERKQVPIVPLDEISIVVPFGGDGTFLGAVHLVDFAAIPMLGFNYGTLGFLSGNPDRDEVELIVDALSGDLVFERRATLDAVILDESGEKTEVSALNELAFTRGSSGHVVRFSYAVNGIHIATLNADGIVAATATGSTAYALSCGGSILSPGYGGLSVVPVAPHSLNTRALVLAPSDVLELDVEDRSAEDATAFIDGMSLTGISPVHIEVKKGNREVIFARGGGDFFTNVSKVFFS